MLSLRSTLASSSVLALLAAIPRPAEACQPDPCESSNRWASFELVGEVASPDGVLRLSARKNNGLATVEEALAYVELEVTDAGGMLVEGAFEYDAGWASLVWRAAAPLSPGASYDVLLRVDNDALAVALDEEWIAEESWCGENIERPSTLSTTLMSLPPLAVPAPELSSSHQVSSTESLDTLVCCDGAMPINDFNCADYDSVYWNEGHCSATRGFGTVTALAQIADGTFSPERVASLAVRMVQTNGDQVRRAEPGQLSVSLADRDPFCARMEVLDLVNGDEWAGPEQCVGDDLVDVLGDHEIDPGPELAGVCVGQPYVCESEGGQWDPETCTPWGDPPGEDESGGAGDDSSGGGADDGDGSTGADDGSTDGDTAGQDDGDISDRGCSCRSAPGGSGPCALWLLVVGLGWRGARRSRSRAAARG